LATYDDQRISIVFLNEGTPNADYERSMAVLMRWST
jgi:hypothetical protein